MWIPTGRRGLAEQRKLPTGGLVYGMPRKIFTPEEVSPSIEPIGGGHETLTEFWIREVKAHGQEGVTELPSDLWKRDYPADIVKDRRARREYVKPGEA